MQYEGVYNFPEQSFDKVLDETEVTDDELEDEVGPTQLGSQHSLSLTALYYGILH